MKLYTFETAPNPLRLHYFMRYKGIEIETQQIDLAAVEQLHEDYKTVNPKCTVPTLELAGGTILTDVIAICVYLESLYPEKPLLGTDALQRAQVIGWDHQVFFDGFMSIAEMLRNKSKHFANRALPGPLKIPQIPELVERGQLRLRAYWPTLDEHLSGRSYFVGDSLTLADIDVYVLTNFAGWVKEAVPESCVNLLAWQQRVKSILED